MHLQLMKGVCSLIYTIYVYYNITKIQIMTFAFFLLMVKLKNLTTKWQVMKIYNGWLLGVTINGH